MNIMIRMTEQEYLGRNGVGDPMSGYVLDKCRLPHGETEKQKKKRMQMCAAADAAYAEKRAAVKAEYKRLVEEGEIVPKTRQEETIEKAAYGHPDNEATQAARRICDKRGWKWRCLI